MRQVLLNMPMLEGGHYRIYCRELCDYFLSRDFFVTIAADLTGLHEYGQLEVLLDHPRVRFISDTWTGEARPAAQLRELTATVREVAADVVFLADHDRRLGLLTAQITRPWQRLPGRRVGLFLTSTNYVHDVRRPQLGRVGGRVEQAFLTLYRHRPLSPAQQRNFHQFVMRYFPVLEAALSVDEVFVAKEGGSRYHWLPDIAVWSGEGGQGSTEAAAWEAEISAFLATQGSRPVVAYVGMPQRRRGYEQLLQLACDIEGCLIHCGKLHGPGCDRFEQSPARATLHSRSAILESGRFYQDFDTAKVTFRAARCVVLPYRMSHLGSSGVMLQALMAGRPLLVPDQGLMGWRVRNFGLGLTYAPEDMRDVRYKFSLMQNMPTDSFTDAIGRFLAYFSRAQFEAAMDAALGLAHAGARLPRADESAPASLVDHRA